jgi:hypothetical protein
MCHLIMMGVAAYRGDIVAHSKGRRLRLELGVTAS